ncbi:MAG: hypothetical protein ACRDO0_16890 [Nocardioidaceae bacterium]
MNTLLKGIIVTLATIFGFALIAAGVSIAVSPSGDTSAVAKRDHVVAKRDDDSSPVLSVVQDDDNDGNGLADDNGGQTRTRTGHRANVRAGVADDDGVADDNGGQTRTRTRTGHRANVRAGVADDDGVADDNGGQTRARTGHRAGGDDHGNSGPGGGDDQSRDFSRDLTNTD